MAKKNVRLIVLSALFVVGIALYLLITPWPGVSFTELKDGAAEGYIAGIEKDNGAVVFYGSLQAAIDEVEPGETITILNDTVENITSSGQSYTVDFDGHKIDGNGNGRVFSISGGTVILKNGTLTNGYANGDEEPDNNGGGLYIDGGIVTLEAMKVTDNQADLDGGGIYLQSGDLTVTGCEITENSSVKGGGVYSHVGPWEYTDFYGTYQGNYPGSFTVENTLVSGNTASNLGGGIYGSDMKLTKVNFTQNDATRGGVALYATRADKVFVDECTFYNNHGSSPTYNTLINLTDDFGDMGGTFTFNKCNITHNDNVKHIIYIDNGDINWKEKHIDVTFTDCVVSDNTAQYTGGIYMNYLSTVTLNNTVVKNNTASETASGVTVPVGGVSVYNSADNIFTFKSGAIYNNFAPNGDAKDLYVGQWAKVEVIKACDMTDNFAEDKPDFSDYVWRLPDNRFIDKEMAERFANTEYKTSLLLTAFNASTPPTVQYNGVEYNSISAAIAEAKQNGTAPAELKLLFGKNKDGELDSSLSAFYTESVAVNFPIILDIGDCSLNTKDPTLFSVTENGSLTLHGSGTLDGLIKVENDSVLTLETNTESNLNIKFENENAKLVIGESFEKCGKLRIELDKTRADALTTPNNDSADRTYPIILGAGEKIAIPNVTVVYGTKRLVEIYSLTSVVLMGNDITAVNPTVKSALYVGGKNADDGNDGGLGNPLATVEHAIDLLKEQQVTDGIIFLEGTFEVNDPAVWDGTGYDITIKRYVNNTDPNTTSNDANGQHMLTVKSSLTLKNITFDGGRGVYKNCGSIINVASGGTITLDEGAVLTNNSRVDSTTGLSGGYSKYSGGAIFSNGGGTINIKGGEITNCNALLGGAVFCNNGKINVTGGKFEGNSAEGKLDLNQSGSKRYYGSGGGIAVTGQSLMNVKGGEFIGNSATYGGAISVGTGEYSFTNEHIETISSTRDVVKTATLTLTIDGDGVLFKGNTATSNGGALFVQASYRADVKAGSFIGNSCSFGGNFGGGAIYVNGGKDDEDTGVRICDGELWLTKVLITGNKADNYGGGIAGCGTSGTVINMVDGSVIYGNTAKLTLPKAGHEDEYPDYPCDISSTTDPEIINQFDKKKDQQTQDYFTQYMIDGTPYHWRFALNSVGYSKGDLASESYLSNDSGKILYTDARPKTETIKDLKVFIIGNYSGTSGGGIGTNGSVYIGGNIYVPPTENRKPDESAMFNVDKEWVENPYIGEPVDISKIKELNIWVLTLDNDSNQSNIIHNRIIHHSIWKGSTVSFEKPDDDKTVIVMEQVIYDDDSHVWSVRTEDMDKYELDITAAVGEVMDTVYDSAEIMWSTNYFSPFSSDFDFTKDSGDYVITNSPNYGDLTVSKKVTGNIGEKDKEFTFTVTLSDGSINGSYGDMEFVNGEATFTLKHNESLTAVNLPAGITYTVVEEEANLDGYVTTSKNEQGKIPNGFVEVSFENNRQKPFSVSKVWVGDGSETHPSSVKVQLYYNGKALREPVTLSEENGWTYTWDDLEYSEGLTVEEVNIPECYTARVDDDSNGNGWIITNKKNDDVSVKKVWKGDSSETRPQSVQVQLYHNGEIYGDPVTLDGENDWEFTWTDLIYPDGWSVEEVNVPKGYNSTATQDGDDCHKWTVTNEKNDDVSVKKVWKGDDSANRPQSVKVQLYHNGEPYGKAVTLDGENGWEYTWKDLIYPDGWTVAEVNAPEGYKSTATADNENDCHKWTVTNEKYADISVKKVWKGDDVKTRPQSIKVQLYLNGEPYGEAVTLDGENGWEYTWTDLLYPNEWTVNEVNVPDGYTPTVTHTDNEWTVTNEKFPDVSVKKVWKDGDSADRPKAVIVQLYHDGEAYGGIAILNNDNGWEYTWKDLIYPDGWTVAEILTPEGYNSTATADSEDDCHKWTVTNERFTDISVKKVWKDGDSTNRPQSVQVQLYFKDEPYGEAVTLDGENGWEYTWTVLIYPDGWTVKEVEVPNGYTSTVTNAGNEWTVTNEKNADVSVKKVWKDSDSANRPQSVQVQLYHNGEPYGEAVTLDEENDWEHTWTELIYPDGWTVKEVEVPKGYTSTVTNVGNEWTVTNEKNDDISVKKVWKDGNSPDRPKTVIVQLYHNGEPYGGIAVLNSDNGWEHTWTELIYPDGWTVEEVNVPKGYYSTVDSDSSGNGWIITNEKIDDVSVKKVWKDGDSATRPQSVQVQLYHNGEPYGQPVTLDEENGWEYTWTNLMYPNGWTVEEVEVPEGYTATVTGGGNNWVITNEESDEEQAFTVSVTKVWDDGDGAGRPEFVTVQLYRYGKPYGDEVTLNAENGWEYTWSDLPDSDGWEVGEVNIPGGYSAAVTDDGNNWVITNTKNPELEQENKFTDVSVTKIWDDNNSTARPTSVTVQLLRDDEAFGAPVVLSVENNWNYTWENLEIAHKWSIEELNVPEGYHASIAHKGMKWTVTNTNHNDDETHDVNQDFDKPSDVPDTGIDLVDLGAIIMILSLVAVLAYKVFAKKES